jgi:hypothetical protein
MLKELFTLGDLYVSDFISEGESPRAGKFEMKLMFDEETKCVRLEKMVPPEAMYGKYWYRSGTNLTMKKELKNIVESILEVKKLNDNDIWIDIACNDGTLLSNVPKNLIKVGIDPVDNSFKQESQQHANLIIQDFFNKDSYEKSIYGDRKASVITTIAMFYDLDKPEVFLNDIHSVLDDNGLFVLQMSYTPLMIEQMAFDNICHEHVYYYSLHNINELLKKCGFKVVDCQLNDTNGGSFRIYIMKENSDVTTFSTQPYRDVCNFRVNSLLEYEEKTKVNTPEIWNIFYKRMETLKNDLITFIKDEKSKGKKIWGYGASTKGNTLLQYFGLDNTLIDGIAERSPYKFGKKTIGTNIPVTSEEDMRDANPDYLLVLPWHFINEFVSREKEFLDRGGKFIVPCPKFEIIGSKN